MHEWSTPKEPEQERWAGKQAGKKEQELSLTAHREQLKTEHADRKTGKRGSNGRARRVYCKLAKEGEAGGEGSGESKAGEGKVRGQEGGGEAATAGPGGFIASWQRKGKQEGREAERARQGRGKYGGRGGGRGSNGRARRVYCKLAKEGEAGGEGSGESKAGEGKVRGQEGGGRGSNGRARRVYCKLAKQSEGVKKGNGGKWTQKNGCLQPPKTPGPVASADYTSTTKLSQQNTTINPSHPSN